jgi:hypothetical protein
VELFAKFDSVMAEHIRRIHDKDTHVHYLGKDMQYQLIQIISEAVREEILENLKNAKYCSIIVDCTPDISKVEQISVVVRFIQIKDGEELRIQEHFLNFLPVEQTSGEELTKVILQELRKYNIPLENMQGQAYDNASNMKGKCSGVQHKILCTNPRAFFIPRNSHSLNLVVNDAAMSSRDAVSFFGVVQIIYVFLSTSPCWWSVLKKHVSQLTEKLLSDTRWESRIDSIRPFRYQAREIYDALRDISQEILMIP